MLSHHSSLTWNLNSMLAYCVLCLLNKCQKFKSKYEYPINMNKDHSLSPNLVACKFSELFHHGSQGDTDTAFTVFPVDHRHHCAAQHNPYIVSHLPADFQLFTTVHKIIPSSDDLFEHPNKTDPIASSIRFSETMNHDVAYTSLSRCQTGTLDSGPTS